MPRELKPCGTFAAYERHLRNGESVDDACAAAARDQKNGRVDESRARSAEVVQLALAVEPLIDGPVSELDEALENLRIVRAAMADAPANAIAALSKRREDLVSRIAKMQQASNPEVSKLDQLAQRRADRLAASAV